MGTDKKADVLWVGNSWGGNLARIDTRTMETSFVPLPENLQPYHVMVDSNHNAWTNLWMTDQVAMIPRHRQMDGLRPADAGQRGALRVGRGARRQGAGGPALLPDPEGRGHDLAQRGRLAALKGQAGR